MKGPRAFGVRMEEDQALKLEQWWSLSWKWFDQHELKEEDDQSFGLFGFFLSFYMFLSYVNWLVNLNDIIIMS